MNTFLLMEMREKKNKKEFLQFELFFSARSDN
jgi:hypothetical protein